MAHGVNADKSSETSNRAIDLQESEDEESSYALTILDGTAKPGKKKCYAQWMGKSIPILNGLVALAHHVRSQTSLLPCIMWKESMSLF